MRGIVTQPLEKMIALGGVATGMVNANDDVTAMGMSSRYG